MGHTACCILWLCVAPLIADKERIVLTSDWYMPSAELLSRVESAGGTIAAIDAPFLLKREYRNRYWTGRMYVDPKEIVVLSQSKIYYEELLRTDPLRQSILFLLGMTHISLDNLTSSKEIAERLRTLDVDSDYYKLLNSAILFRSGEQDRALRELDKGAAHPSVELKFYSVKARMQASSGDFVGAEQSLSLAIKSRPNEAIWWYERGYIRYLLKKYDDMISDLNKSIELDDKYYEAYNNRAWVRATVSNKKVRNSDLAIVDARKACEMTDYSDPRSLTTLAAAYAAIGNYPSAVKWQEKAISLIEQESTSENEKRSRLDTEMKHLSLFKGNVPLALD
jgi:tetratricopeptide (TPR) repeat protein